MEANEENTMPNLSNEMTPRGRLIEVAEWLEGGALPILGISGFDMTSFRYRTACGTACCIAGAIIEFEAARKAVSYGKMLRLVGAGEELEAAAHLCGLSIDEAFALFIPAHMDMCAIGPRCAAATVRRYLDTGRVEWGQTEAA